MVAALRAPMPGEEQLASFADVFALAKAADITPPRDAGYVAAPPTTTAEANAAPRIPGADDRSLANA